MSFRRDTELCTTRAVFMCSLLDLCDRFSLSNGDEKPKIFDVKNSNRLIIQNCLVIQGPALALTPFHQFCCTLI